jgi:hypothetical protein
MLKIKLQPSTADSEETVQKSRLADDGPQQAVMVILINRVVVYKGREPGHSTAPTADDVGNVDDARRGDGICLFVHVDSIDTMKSSGPRNAPPTKRRLSTLAVPCQNRPVPCVYQCF